MDAFLESDMYEPVKDFFSRLGYQVNAEVKDCDIALIKDGELTVIELKRYFSTDLLIQAIDRQSFADFVYIAVPRPKSARDKKFQGMLKIVKKLELGLILIAMDSPVKLVEVAVFPPTPQRNNSKRRTAKKQSVITEASGRTGDYNKGGSSKQKLNTAYREKCIKILCALNRCGNESPKNLIKLYDCDPKTGRILGINHYGWFAKIEKGIYGLSKAGEEAFAGKEFSALIDYYRKLM